jgi:hypothetical protein
MENLEQDVNAKLLNSKILLIVLLRRKTFLDLSGVGKVMLLSHHHTCEGEKDLYNNHPRLQRGYIMFNHLQAQYSLLSTRP